MTTFNTRTGPIYYDDSGNDHRPNLVDSVPKFAKRHAPVKLQRAAWKAFRQAEKDLGRRLGKGPWSKRKARPFRLTSSWRSFSWQAHLYATDRNRYASPFTSGHVQGIAIDLDTGWEHFELAREILRKNGWFQSRADEPWHWTWGVSV